MFLKREHVVAFGHFVVFFLEWLPEYLVWQRLRSLGRGMGSSSEHLYIFETYGKEQYLLYTNDLRSIQIGACYDWKNVGNTLW